MKYPPEIDPNYTCTGWIETYTGRRFDSLNPDPAQLSIIDIAHALSNQCRYSGHIEFFYSTAQHCVLLADHVAEKGGSSLDCLQMLMHDAPEAYLVDIPRPVKQFMPQYRVWDKAIEDAVRNWLGLADVPHFGRQEELDSRIIVDEKAALFSHSRNDWDYYKDMKPLGVKIDPWMPRYAETQFLMRYAAWTNSVFGAMWYMRENWTTGALQVMHATASDDAKIADVYEVDFRGNIARVKLRGEDGLLIRDRDAGMPVAAWEWREGEFMMQQRQAS